jgi:cobalt transport protein
VNKTRNLLLLAAAVLLVGLPLVMPGSWTRGTFAGSDDQAEEAVKTLDPAYVPWMKSVWKPPSEEVATMLFTLQAAIGAGVFGYVLGYLRCRAALAGNADARP